MKARTIGEAYAPAMKITDQAEADRYFEKLVQWAMENAGQTRKQAEEIQRNNLGCFAGHYDHETRLRVERLFRCHHPIFGAATNGEPTAEDALEAGKRMAEKRGE